MIGVIASVDASGRRAKISAPHVDSVVRLHRYEFRSDIPLSSELVGAVVTFRLCRDRRGWYGSDCWITSGDAAANADGNLVEIDEFFVRRREEPIASLLQRLLPGTWRMVRCQWRTHAAWENRWKLVEEKWLRSTSVKWSLVSRPGTRSLIWNERNDGTLFLQSFFPIALREFAGNAFHRSVRSIFEF